MISWQSIMSVFNTKGTLLKWLKTLDQSLKDGVLETVTVNNVSEGVITLSFNFADGSVITTPNIDIPHVDIPTPTTADNGKVLGVTNGAYALQEASGGGTQLYLHEISYSSGGYSLSCQFISNVETEFTSWSFMDFYYPILTNGTLEYNGKTYIVTEVSSLGDTGLVVRYFDPAHTSYVNVWYADYPENISDSVRAL